MGSFNTTCFASQQTIAPSDKCYVIPVCQAASYRPVSMHRQGKDFERYGIAHSNSYPHATWLPVANFIEGEYNDYGRIKLVNTPANHACLITFFQKLLKNVFVVRQGENKYHDLPFDFHAYINNNPRLKAILNERRDVNSDERHTLLSEAWAYYEEVSQKNRVFMKGWAGDEPRQVQHAIIHAIAFNWLVDYAGDAPARRAGFDTLFDEVMSRVKNPDPAVADMVAISLATKLDRLGFVEGLSFCEEDELEPLVARYFRSEISKDEFYEAVRPWFDSRFVMKALTGMNLRLTPLAFSHQDYSNELGQDYARFVAETCSQVTAGLKELYDEYDDDEECSDEEREEREQLEFIARCDPSFLLAHIGKDTMYDVAVVARVFELAKERASHILGK